MEINYTIKLKCTFKAIEIEIAAIYLRLTWCNVVVLKTKYIHKFDVTPSISVYIYTELLLWITSFFMPFCLSYLSNLPNKIDNFTLTCQANERNLLSIIKFDITDDIDNKVKKAARLTVQCAPERYRPFNFTIWLLWSLKLPVKSQLVNHPHGLQYLPINWGKTNTDCHEVKKRFSYSLFC